MCDSKNLFACVTLNTLSDNSEHENISNHKRNTCVHRKATRLTDLRRYIGRRDADGPLLSDGDRCAVPVHTEATRAYWTSGWLAAPRESRMSGERQGL